MAFNPELSFKALEKRVGGMETAADKLEAQLRGGDFKTFNDRLTKLENLVKALVESRIDTKVEAMSKTLQALNNAKLVDEPTMRKLWEDRDKKIQDQMSKENMAYADKAVAEAAKLTEKIKVEARLTVIEAKLASLNR
jgi:predicted oxidoreductase